MGCFFSNNKKINKIDFISQNKNIEFNDTKPFINKGTFNNNFIKYKLIKNKLTKNTSLTIIKYLKKIIVNIHKSLLLNTDYSNFDLDKNTNVILFKIKCIKIDKNEYIFNLESYNFTFIILDYINVNLHIHFLNYVYNLEQFNKKNIIDSEILIKKYVKDIEFCTFLNMDFSLHAYFDWSWSSSYKQSIFNMNNFNNNIEVYIILPIVTKNLNFQIY